MEGRVYHKLMHLLRCVLHPDTTIFVVSGVIKFI